jgi:integrase/recombinase XerD
MSDKPISDLRRRLIADMTIRSFSDKTQRDYIRQIETFASFLGRSPDTATGDDIRRFQFAQVELGAQRPKMNSQVSALRFFFTITLGRADLADQLARTHYLPRVLTPDQVGRLIEAAPSPGLKHKAALSIAYGAGLRGCEVVMLRIGDIDSKRMLIRVEMGKGSKDRHAMLSPQLLELLRARWLQCRSKGWLFPGRDPLLPMTVRQLNRVSPADQCLCHQMGTPQVQAVARSDQGRKRLARPAPPSESKAFCPLVVMPWQRPNNGSRMNREIHVRFWERPEVKVLRATRHLRSHPPQQDSTARSVRRRKAKVGLLD